jgi:hypothetical protein
MKALLTFFRRAPRVRNDLLRSGQFDNDNRIFSPYLAMLPGVQG